MITRGDKQTQTAGDGSQQLQATNMVVNMGIDEKRAREICQEMTLQLRQDYSEEALKIAKMRVIEFENKLMPKMEAVEGALEIFADPSFQLLLVEAQKTAAASERPADYDLLAELLVHRFEKGENRIARAGINRAVEIVDKISDDALLGLTAFHVLTSFIPSSQGILQALNILNNLFDKIIYDTLPTGKDWLDHLDILDTIRINPIGVLYKIEEFYPKILSEQIDIGIEKNSQNHNDALNLLKGAQIPIDILVDHELNNNFVRINLPNKESIDNLKIKQPVLYNQNLLTPLSNQQKNTILSIYDLYNNDSNIKQQNISAFMIEWDKFSNLKTLRYWWDNISISFNLTSAGTVLAHSNAQRCYKDLPNI
ncbi:LPO_1073/Vpar_1526 family protein [Chryseobacterium aureum]|uniref:LPO_1073/Vpar_1526 family protein n=1 Tax=Chryseobacterium aureum TaxID=2497456 RepID=UPI000F8638B2|nr:LPO_1073/Vpar_1526 family protein [Chryseobacterium aureum]